MRTKKTLAGIALLLAILAATGLIVTLKKEGRIMSDPKNIYSNSVSYHPEYPVYSKQQVETLLQFLKTLNDGFAGKADASLQASMLPYLTENSEISIGTYYSEKGEDKDIELQGAAQFKTVNLLDRKVFRIRFSELLNLPGIRVSFQFDSRTAKISSIMVSGFMNVYVNKKQILETFDVQQKEVGISPLNLPAEDGETLNHLAYYFAPRAPVGDRPTIIVSYQYLSPADEPYPPFDSGEVNYYMNTNYVNGISFE